MALDMGNPAANKCRCTATQPAIRVAAGRIFTTISRPSDSSRPAPREVAPFEKETHRHSTEPLNAPVGQRRVNPTLLSQFMRKR